MLNTLEIYKENDLPYYGGGANAEEARQPVLMEVNSNKIAFMGCNGKLKYAKATATVPGAADCDYDFFVEQIKEVKAQGYMVIFTFQHEECYFAGPCFTHEEGFHKVADSAGAPLTETREILVSRSTPFVTVATSRTYTGTEPTLLL